MVEYILNRETRKSLIEEIDSYDGSIEIRQYVDMLEHLFASSIVQQERELSGMEGIKDRLKLRNEIYRFTRGSKK